MAVLQFVVYSILGEASLLIGLMALVGLLIQKKPADKVISGTIKTIVGFLIFGIGSSAAQGALSGFQALFVPRSDLRALPLFPRQLRHRHKHCSQWLSHLSWWEGFYAT